MNNTTMGAPTRGPRADLEERLYWVRQSIGSLDVIIEQLYSVCHVAGASNGGTIDGGTHGFGENDSEDALRDAWKRVTSLGVERTALRREATVLLEALQELEKRPILTCEVCGRDLDQWRQSRRYCSNACKQKAWRQGMAKRRGQAGETGTPRAVPVSWIDD